jgi:hypothetical protein
MAIELFKVKKILNFSMLCKLMYIKIEYHNYLLDLIIKLFSVIDP